MRDTQILQTSNLDNKHFHSATLDPIDIEIETGFVTLGYDVLDESFDEPK